MHQKYTLARSQKNNEWFTYCSLEGRKIFNSSKSGLIYHLRNKNESKFCRIRKNHFIVSLNVVNT